METRNSIVLIALAAFAGGLPALPARADDASCKPVSDAEAKMARTPYHEVSTVGGKPFEKIYTTTTLSMRTNNGKWMTVPMTPQEVLDAKREAGSSYSDCKVLRAEIVDGQHATVYAAHVISSTASITSDNQIWIADNGLTLKTVSDTQMQGRKVHAESRVTYDNVQAPTGAQ
ncbi:MAG: hypothetical protein JSS59_03320 [Proteobacteria bacterium]|uniref:hypothetical protein n=1 Tax=Rudaea sp. TaxID=2136325 RepID=UPI00378383A8|nr:hypothetical protein [Pseudomonadota bacterium]